MEPEVSKARPPGGPFSLQRTLCNVLFTFLSTAYKIPEQFSAVAIDAGERNAPKDRHVKQEKPP